MLLSRPQLDRHGCDMKSDQTPVIHRTMSCRQGTCTVGPIDITIANKDYTFHLCSEDGGILKQTSRTSTRASSKAVRQTGLTVRQGMGSRAGGIANRGRNTARSSPTTTNRLSGGTTDGYAKTCRNFLGGSNSLCKMLHGMAQRKGGKNGLSESLFGSNSNLFDNLWNRKNYLSNGLFGGKNNLFNNLINGKNHLFNNMLNGKSTLFNNVLNGKSNVFNNVLNGKNNLFNNMLNGKNNLFNNLLGGQNDLSNGLLGGKNNLLSQLLGEKHYNNINSILGGKGGLSDLFNGNTEAPSLSERLSSAKKQLNTFLSDNRRKATKFIADVMDVEEESDSSCRQSCLDGDNTNMVSLYKCMYRKVRDFNNDLEGLFHEDQILAFWEGLVGTSGKSKDVYQLLIELFGMFKPKNGPRKAHPESATRLEINPRQPNNVHIHVHNHEHNNEHNHAHTHEHAYEHNSGNNHEHNHQYNHEHTHEHNSGNNHEHNHEHAHEQSNGHNHENNNEHNSGHNHGENNGHNHNNNNEPNNEPNNVDDNIEVDSGDLRLSVEDGAEISRGHAPLPDGVGRDIASWENYVEASHANSQEEEDTEYEYDMLG